MRCAEVVDEIFDMIHRPYTENAALDDDGNGEHGATSSDPAIPNPAPLPAIPDPNRLETHASNTNQHPGKLHNTYTIKKRTKEEMVEVRRIEVTEKEKRAEKASREAVKLDSAMKIIANNTRRICGGQT